MRLVVALPVGFLACTAAPGTDDTAGGTTPGEPGVGLRHFAGEATVQGGYEGWEAFRFTADQGRGEDLCRIRYTMTQEAERTDCPDCLWAFDLVTTNAAVEVEAGVGCAGLGIEPGSLEGWRYSYGYAAASGSYESVLMYQVGDYGWYPVTRASWQDPQFSYDWELGLYYY